MACFARYFIWLTIISFDETFLLSVSFVFFVETFFSSVSPISFDETFLLSEKEKFLWSLPRCLVTP